MIKLKNLWKVALATMAMTAMLVACDEGSSKKDDNKGGDSLGGTGVYSYTVDIKDISGAWGGSTKSPAFSVVLLTDELFDLCKAKGDFKQAPADTPEYQIGAYGDMRISDTSKTGNFAPYGKSAEDQNYTGVAVTIDEATVTVTVDMTKLVITDLKALWTGDKEGVMTNDDIVDLKGYKPYVVALSSETADPDNYCFSAWSGAVMKMEEGATFPSGELIKDAPAVTLTINDVNSVKGTINGWSQTNLLADDSFEFTYSSTMTEVRFIYIVFDEEGNDAGKNFKPQGSECEALDTDVAIKDDEGTEDYCKFALSLFEDGATYKVTLDKAKSTCKITKK